MRRTGGPPLLREINQASVLRVLRSRGPLRVSELAALTGLSRPTVSDVARELNQAGWVALIDAQPDGPGRPARLVRFRSEAGHVVGVDVGPHRVTVMLACLDGEVIARVHRTSTKARSARETLAALRDGLEAVFDRSGVAKTTVLAAVVGTPGIVERASRVVTFAPGLPGWDSINLGDQVREALGCPVQVENDVNLAVVGECRMGVGRGLDTVVYVLWGERLGAGISINGHLHRGRVDAAGEIGYLRVFGNRSDASADEEGLGPFERLVSAGAIASLGQQAAKQDGGTLRGLPKSRLDAAAVFAAAEQGDAVAQRTVETVVRRMARGLAPVVLLLDPDTVVIGGGVSQAGPFMLDSLRRQLRKLTLAEPDLRLSSLGADAVVVGAVSLALDDAERRFFPGGNDLIEANLAISASEGAQAVRWAPSAGTASVGSPCYSSTGPSR